MNIADELNHLVAQIAAAMPKWRIEQWAGMGPDWTPVTEWADRATTITAIADLPHWHTSPGSSLYRLVSEDPTVRPMQFIPNPPDGIMTMRDGSDIVGGIDKLRPFNPAPVADGAEG